MSKFVSGLLHCLLLGSLPFLPACDQRPSAQAAWTPSRLATASITMSSAELNQLYAGIPLAAKLATLANLDTIRFSSLASLVNGNADLPALNLDGKAWSVTVNPAALARLDARYGSLGELMRQSGATASELAEQTDIAGLFQTGLRQAHSGRDSSLSLTASENCLPASAVPCLIYPGIGLVLAGFTTILADVCVSCASKSRVLDVETGEESTEENSNNSADPAMRGRAAATKRARMAAGGSMFAAGACLMVAGIVVQTKECP